MRLTCPNCGAQYEVDARVIPEGGRDVQCSNCGHTWFQRPAGDLETSMRRVVADSPMPAQDDVHEDESSAPGLDEDSRERVSADEDEMARGTTAEYEETYETEEAEAEDRPPEPSRPWSEPPEEPEPPEESEPPKEETTPDHEPVDEDTIGVPNQAPEEVSASEPEADRPLQRAAADDHVLSVLREEAEREARVRAEEARATIETQTELGLGARTENAPARERMARLRGVDEGEDEDSSSVLSAAISSAAARRDALPDVDDINSTLRAEEDRAMGRAQDADELAEKPESGFRRGFLWTLLLVVLLLLVYLFAPKLAEAVPALRPVLATYVEAANGLRDWVSGLIGQGGA